MANTRKVSLSKKAQDRPQVGVSRAETVTERPTRVKLTDGYRDILTVSGQDPDYAYRFVKDVDGIVTDVDGSVKLKEGQRIMRFKAAGWTFVESDTVTVGENHIYKTENLGSIVRIPAGNTEYLYLMRIHRDWYEEDQEEKNAKILDLEEEYSGSPDREGMYGSVSIG